MQGFKGKARVVRTRVCVGATAALVVCGGTVGGQALLAQSANAAVKHKTTKHKHKKKKPAVKAAMPAACAAVAPTESALGAILTAFLQHIDAAHLQTSPQDQITALLADTNNYVLLHTILVENMVAPTEAAVGQLGDVVNGLVTPLIQHIDSAHLSTSPADQVNAILNDTNNYVLLHTILVNNMIGPLESLLSRVASGTPGTICAPSAAPASAAPATAPGPKTVTISNFKFDTPTLTIPAGTTVTWKNSDSSAHTITSMGTGPLNSPNIAPGGTFSYTFASPGTFMYVCSIHPNMMATVVVT